MSKVPLSAQAKSGVRFHLDVGEFGVLELRPDPDPTPVRAIGFEETKVISAAGGLEVRGHITRMDLDWSVPFWYILNETNDYLGPLQTAEGVSLATAIDVAGLNGDAVVAAHLSAIIEVANHLASARTSVEIDDVLVDVEGVIEGEHTLDDIIHACGMPDTVCAACVVSADAHAATLAEGLEVLLEELSAAGGYLTVSHVTS